MVNLLCQFSWNSCSSQSLVNVLAAYVREQDLCLICFGLGLCSLISLTHLSQEKKKTKWSLITHSIYSLSSLLLHFSSFNPCIFPVLDYWCPLHHVPLCFSDEITLYSSHFWSVYACSYSAAIHMDSFDWSMYVNKDKNKQCIVKFQTICWKTIAD